MKEIPLLKQRLQLSASGRDPVGGIADAYLRSTFLADYPRVSKHVRAHGW